MWITCCLSPVCVHKPPRFNKLVLKLGSASAKFDFQSSRKTFPYRRKYRVTLVRRSQDAKAMANLELGCWQEMLEKGAGEKAIGKGRRTCWGSCSYSTQPCWWPMVSLQLFLDAWFWASHHFLDIFCNICHPTANICSWSLTGQTIRGRWTFLRLSFPSSPSPLPCKQRKAIPGCSSDLC